MAEDESSGREVAVVITQLTGEVVDEPAPGGVGGIKRRAGEIAAAVGGASKALASKGAGHAKSATSAAARKTAALAASIGNGAAVAADQTGKASAKIAQGVAGTASGLAHAVGDLNGDGKIDEEDFRIAREALAKAAGAVGAEAAELGKSVLRHEMTKDAVAGAAIGAAIAVPVPFVGPAGGAAVGAAFAVTRGVLGRPAADSLAGQALAAGAGAASDLAKKGLDAAKTTRPRKPRKKKGA